MSGGPLVSIGCAVYNGERTLARALSGLVSQDYANLEIIVADDASTDGSPEICQEFARRDRRIRLLPNATNIGLLRNFSGLVHAANGTYFMWADQDDVREPTFVSKAVRALERDPEAVLCHSHTGIFVDDPTRLTAIGTLGGVAEHRHLLTRYCAFLRQYSDTAIYGLIRAETLRRTHLWRNDLGSANALLFELLLHGPFIQIPEVLYLYAGRGLRNRPGPRAEYARQHGGKPMPRYYVPFLVLAANQTTDIVHARASAAMKAALLLALWSNVALVNAAKLLYRVVHRLLLGRVPPWFTALCESALGPQSHIVYVGARGRDEHLYPKGWALRGRA